jgi:hypothetical protein
MSRYNFQSSGAAAGNAIEQFLVQRALADRQRRIDELNAQNTKADNARADEQLFRQQENDKRMASAQDDAARLTKAQAAAGSLGIGGRISPEDPNAGLISQYLPGVLDQDMTLPSRHMAGAGIPGVMARTEDVAPQATGMMISRGTAQQKQAADAITAREREQEDARAARAAEGEASRAAAAARAQDANDMRMQLAQLANSGRNANADLDRQIKQGKIDADAQKRADADKAAKASADAVSTYEGDISGVLNQLLDEQGNLRPEAARVVGGISARLPNLSETSQQGLSQIDRLVGLLDINKLREMKAQSKTGASGFGALSERELSVLENAASTLKNRKVGEGDYAAELRRIRDTLHKPQAATGAGRVYYDANGNPVQR